MRHDKSKIPIFSRVGSSNSSSSFTFFHRRSAAVCARVSTPDSASRDCPGTGPAWFVPVVPLGVLGLASASYIVSWKQRSFLVAGLLAATSVLLMIPSLIATGNLATIVLPGPILGVIIGVGIFGLGVAKGVRTARSAMVIVR